MRNHQSRIRDETDAEVSARAPYAGWLLAAVALHAAVVFTWSKVIDLRPEYGVAAAESIELTLVESAGKPATEPMAEPAPPPEPEAVPPPPEPIPEPQPPPEPEMIAPQPDTPPPVPKPASTPRPSRRTTAPAKAASLPAGAAAGAPGSGGPSGVRTNARPNYLSNPPPPYPAASRQAHEEGTVVLTVAVTEQGRAASVRLHRSSGFPRLDEAALRAVQRPDRRPRSFVRSASPCPVSAQIAAHVCEQAIRHPIRTRSPKRGLWHTVRE
jgi:periplasmic protein TonB